MAPSPNSKVPRVDTMAQNPCGRLRASFLSFRSPLGSTVTIDGEAYTLYGQILAAHVGAEDFITVTSVPESILDHILSLSGLSEATQSNIRNLSTTSTMSRDSTSIPVGHVSWQEALVLLYFVQLFSGSVSLEELLLPDSRIPPVPPKLELAPGSNNGNGNNVEAGSTSVEPPEWGNSETFSDSRNDSRENRQDYPSASVGPEDVDDDEGASEPHSRETRSIASTATATQQNALYIVSPGLEPAPIRDLVRQRLADLVVLCEREQRGTRERGMFGFLKNRKQDVLGVALAKGLEEAVAKGSVAEVEAYLELGADVNSRFDGGRTSTHHAISQGNISLLSLLLSPRWRANPTLTTYGHSHTPLYLAVKAHPASALPSTLLLLKAHAPIDKKAFQAAISDEREELLARMLSTGRAPVKECLRHAVLVGNVGVVSSFLDELGKVGVSESVRNEYLQIAVDARNLPLVQLLAPEWTQGNFEALYRAMKSVAKCPTAPTTTTATNRQISPAHMVISHILALCPCHSPTTPQRRHILNLAIASGDEAIVHTLLSNHRKSLALNVKFKFADRRFRDKTALRVAEDLGMNKIADMIIEAGGYMGGVSFYPPKGLGGPLGDLRRG